MMLVQLFVDNILPILLVAGAGYLLAGALRTDARALAGVAFHLLAPCLVFQILVDSAVTAGDLGRIGAYTAACLVLPALAALAVARWRRWPRTTTSAVVLCVLLPNVGNFGMSANLLAFGPEGLTQSSLFFVAASILTYTVGVLVASLGRAGPTQALRGLLRVPTLWAVALAFALRGTGLSLPDPVLRAVGLLAQACIPAFLLVLGMQLRGATLRAPTGPLLTATALRLAGGTLAGVLLAPLFGLEGVARQSAIFQSAMPTAVITTILATEYEVEPGLATAVVFLTTLLSPFTLTPLLAWLVG